MNLEEKNIREILLGGEETVSPQVWAGVARGLDKAAAVSRRRVVVLWSSLVGLAAAAAVAALVVLTPAGNKQAPSPSVVAEVAAEVSEPVVETPEVIEAVAAPEIQTETIAGQVARSRAAGGSVAYVQEPYEVAAPAEVRTQVNETAEEVNVVGDTGGTEPAAEESPAVSEPEPASSSTVARPASSSAPVKAEPAPSVGSMDPFALLLAEENRIGNKPTAITLSGLAQATRTPSPSYGVGGKMAAPMAPVTGVKETGDNRFELPISVGLGLRFPLVAGLSIGAGVNYTRLARSFTGTYTEAENGMAVRYISDVTISETQHYIGLPVNLYYDFLNNKSFTASAFAGATVERCIGLKYRIPDSGGYINYSGEPRGLQPSVVAGLSLQYNVLPKFALYAEPGVRYYFDGNQPASLRTMQPWMVNLELGLRYEL